MAFGVAGAPSPSFPAAGSRRGSARAISVSSTAGSTGFFWWTARFLLAGRVNWVPLLPGAMLTAAGLVGLRLFSAVVFSPLVISSAVAYGAIGTVVVITSWLIGIGFVLFGGGLLGRLLMENSADRVK